MTRGQPTMTFLAAAAVAAVAAPVTTLLVSTRWTRVAMVAILVVAASGWALRQLRVRPGWVLIAQLVALVAGYLGAVLPSTLWYGLPTLTTARRTFDIVLGAATHLGGYSAPVPPSRELDIVLATLVGLIAVAVDAVAVSLRRPAAAGLLLLTAYLGSSSNTPTGNSAIWLVAPAGLWLLMLAHQGISAVHSWGPAFHTVRGRRREPGDSLAGLGRRLGVLAIGAAIVLGTIAPLLPTRFLAGGLGTGADESGGGTPRGVSMASSADVSRDLITGSDRVAFRYRTPAGAAPVFAVHVLNRYEGGVWTNDRSRGAAEPATALEPPPLDSVITTKSTDIEVFDNDVAPPQVALPPLTVGNPFPGASWTVDDFGTVRLSGTVREYTASSLNLTIPEDFLANLPASNVRPSTAAAVFIEDTPSGADPDQPNDTLGRVLESIIDGEETPVEAARKIQAYLRSPEFSYSLTLTDEGIGGDPLLSFLRTKRGYCVQFAGAMVALADRAGMPARLVVGFLGGTREGDDYVVRGKDAHAWPEIYFDGIGWLRFEPTPGGRGDIPPAYSLTQPRTNPSTGPSASSSPRPSVSALPRGERPDADLVRPTGIAGGILPTWLTQNWPYAVGLLSLALLLCAVPLAARAVRRRRRRRAESQAARTEAEWAELISRLGDLGVHPPEGASPRQTGRFIATTGRLPQEAISHVGSAVALLERARYARPEQAEAKAGMTGAIEEHADAILSAVAARVPRSVRWRAALWPRDGLFWRRQSSGEENSQSR